MHQEEGLSEENKVHNTELQLDKTESLEHTDGTLDGRVNSD